MWSGSAFYLSPHSVLCFGTSFLEDQFPTQPADAFLFFLIKQLVVNSKKIGGSAAGQTKRIEKNRSLLVFFEYLPPPPCISLRISPIFGGAEGPRTYTRVSDLYTGFVHPGTQTHAVAHDLSVSDPHEGM